MSNEIFIEKMREVFDNYDVDSVGELVNQEIKAGGNPVQLLNNIVGILEELGNKFSSGEIFLPELMMAADVMEEASRTLQPALANTQEVVTSAGKILLGTVKSDVHDIGKNIVKTMLVAAGFEVHDLGIDVSAEKFYETSREMHPDIIALSSTMSTTLPSMKDVLNYLEALGVRDEYKVIVGGGSVTQDFADSIGADGYSVDANGAVIIAKQVLK